MRDAARRSGPRAAWGDEQYGLLQALGQDPGAGQQLDGSLAKGQAQRRGGHPQPGQVAASDVERGGELRVRDRAEEGAVRLTGPLMSLRSSRNRMAPISWSARSSS